ncbi:unnamed protein product, partial [Prorocentrum cordatum]
MTGGKRPRGPPRARPSPTAAALLPAALLALALALGGAAVAFAWPRPASRGPRGAQRRTPRDAPRAAGDSGAARLPLGEAAIRERLTQRLMETTSAKDLFRIVEENAHDMKGTQVAKALNSLAKANADTADPRFGLLLRRSWDLLDSWNTFALSSALTALAKVPP